jgi:hypothetical protein
MPAFPDNSQGTPPAGGPKLSAAEFQTWKAQKDEAAAAVSALPPLPQPFPSRNRHLSYLLPRIKPLTFS